MATIEQSATTAGRRERRWSTRLVPRLAALSIMLALVTAACGGGSDEATSGTGSGKGSSAGSGADAQKAFLAYARCMREQGINMPDPDPSGGGAIIDGSDPSIDPEAVAKADKVCGKHLAGVTLDNPDGLSDSEMQDRMVRLTQCLRDRGFNIPDPRPAGSGGGAPQGGEPEFDLNDPNFKKAERECAKAAGLPQPGEIKNEGRRS